MIKVLHLFANTRRHVFSSSAAVSAPNVCSSSTSNHLHNVLPILNYAPSVCEVGEKGGIFMTRDGARGSRAAVGIRGFELNFKPEHRPSVGLVPIKLSNSPAFTAALIIKATL